MTDLSIIIPARNEMFLARTIQDIFEHSEADTEVIVVLEGNWPPPEYPVVDHPRLTLVYQNEPAGQRAASNQAARMAQGQYIMKVDAHCAFDQGFDRKMLEIIQPNWTMAPTMKNLHAFDWVCANGHRRYQGHSGPCLVCSEPAEMDVVWEPKRSPNSTAFRFDTTLHFQYHGEWKRRQAGVAVKSMSLQGSCFMLTKERYFALNVCDEGHGSWGQQGVEVACATWLSGGEVRTHTGTWYAHLFRTQGGDFGFPYPNPGVDAARVYSRELWFNNRHHAQVRPLSWLLDEFKPLPDWHVADKGKAYDPAPLERVEAAGRRWEAARLAGLKSVPSQGIIYYTDNQLDPAIMAAVQAQISKAGLPIVSSSLKRIPFGDKNIHFPSLKRGPVTMFKQILAALEHSRADVIFFCEHDVLYHPSHFDFIPPDPAKVYYNLNVWHLRTSDGHAVTFTAKRLSQICGYRETLLAHYQRRLERCERDGFSMKMGFEPGSHGRKERVDDLVAETWRSELPNIDIKHGGNQTPPRWSPAEFRDKSTCQDWQEADSVPGWPNAAGRWPEFLQDVARMR